MGPEGSEPVDDPTELEAGVVFHLARQEQERDGHAVGVVGEADDDRAIFPQPVLHDGVRRQGAQELDDVQRPQAEGERNERPVPLRSRRSVALSALVGVEHLPAGTGLQLGELREDDLGEGPLRALVAVVHVKRGSPEFSGGFGHGSSVSLLKVPCGTFRWMVFQEGSTQLLHIISQCDKKCNKIGWAASVKRRPWDLAGELRLEAEETLDERFDTFQHERLDFDFLGGGQEVIAPAFVVSELVVAPKPEDGACAELQ